MPVEVGGGGISFSSRCLLEMEAHYHDTVFFEDLLGGGGGPTSVLLAATPEQKQQFLFPLMNGEVTTCFALSEADAGSDINTCRRGRRRPRADTSSTGRRTSSRTLCSPTSPWSSRPRTRTWA
jgi:alkylation response protein AidB-like acyl-CoA dehydrogenase